MDRSGKVAFGAGVVVAVVTLGGFSAPAFAGFNEAPTCSSDSFDTPAGVAVVDGVADLCTDPNEDTLTYFVVPLSGPDNGTLDFDETTGDFTYTPDPGFVGTDDFTFGAEDGFTVPASAGSVEPADASFPAAITINVAAQVTTTLVPTTTSTALTPTTAAVSPTSVLARTGSGNAAVAGGGFLTLGVGLGLVAASGALVARARRRA